MCSSIPSRDVLAVLNPVTENGRESSSLNSLAASLFFPMVVYSPWCLQLLHFNCCCTERRGIARDVHTADRSVMDHAAGRAARPQQPLRTASVTLLHFPPLAIRLETHRLPHMIY